MRLVKAMNSKAQTMVEYSILIGLIVVILFAMSPLIKRGSQSMIKLVADQIGNQENSEQFVNLETGVGTQVLEHSYLTTSATVDKRTEELSGRTTYFFNDTISTTSNALLDLGFTEQ